MITPIAQLKKILDNVNENLYQFAVALLAANGNRIILKEEILLEYSASGKGSDDNCESVTYCPFFIEEIVYKDSMVLVYQSHNGQAVEFDSRFDLVEKENILSKAAFCAENPAKTEYWPITSVARDDVAEAGFDIENISDQDMERLADKMEDAYVGNSFWDDLKTIAEEIGFPKKKKSRYNMGWSQADGKYMIVYAGCPEEAEELFEEGEYELEDEE